MKPKQISIVSFLLCLILLLNCRRLTQSLQPTSTNTSAPTATGSPMGTSSPTQTLTSTATQQPTPTFTATYGVSPDSLFLSDMPFYINPENVYGGLTRDRVFWQAEIWIDGKQYAKGLGMHPPSDGIASVGYRVPPGYTAFKALAGLAREDGNTSCDTVGDARFRVYINKELKFASGLVYFGPPVPIDIAVQAGDVIRLEVDRGEDDYDCDHATWADARFEP